MLDAKDANDLLAIIVNSDFKGAQVERVSQLKYKLMKIAEEDDSAVKAIKPTEKGEKNGH